MTAIERVCAVGQLEFASIAVGVVEVGPTVVTKHKVIVESSVQEVTIGPTEDRVGAAAGHDEVVAAEKRVDGVDQG